MKSYPHSARSYPHWKWLVVMLVGLHALLSACGTAPETQQEPQTVLTQPTPTATPKPIPSPTATPIPTPQGPTPTPSPMLHDLEQSVGIGAWEIYVYEPKKSSEPVTDLTSDGFVEYKPKAGYTFLIIKISMHNNSKEGQAPSSKQWILKSREDKKTYTSLTKIYNDEPNSKVVYARTVRPELVFEVPSSQALFTLEFRLKETDRLNDTWPIAVS